MLCSCTHFSNVAEHAYHKDRALIVLDDKCMTSGTPSQSLSAPEIMPHPRHHDN
jgi:hypothetical protein